MAATAEPVKVTASPGRKPAANALTFLDAVVKWCVERKARVENCFAVSSDGEVWLYVVSATTPFNSALNKELADFAGELNRAGAPVAATLLPPGSPTDMEEYTPPGGVFYHLKLS